jgi:AcrR family transcriptional regulator
MSPRTPKQFEEMRKSSRKLIMNTALELFALNGFHTTSIEKIAKQGRISKGLIYNYFDSKEALLEAVIVEQLDELFGHFDISRIPDNPRAALGHIIEESFTIATRSLEYWRLYWSLVMHPSIPRKFQTQFMARLNKLVRFMGALLDKAGHKDGETEAKILGASLDGIFLYYMMDPDSFDLEKLKNKFIEKYCKE